jgi:hypothetical protein
MYHGSVAIGPVVILLVLFVIGPIGLFVVGAMWSALQGWLQSDAADRRARGGVPSAEELT